MHTQTKPHIQYPCDSKGRSPERQQFLHDMHNEIKKQTANQSLLPAQTKQAKHTALPWTFDKYGNISANGASLLVHGVALPCGNHPDAKEAAANAAFILNAVNSHEELLGALQAIVARIQSGEPGLDGLIQVVNYCDAVARGAIAHATGE